jgi:hypothetical protein
MRSMRLFLCVLPFLCACGGASVVLKSPVESKCGSTGLKGCPELTDGVLLYVDGKEEEGKVKLEHGAAENAPAKLRKFARQIKALKKIPGAEQYTKTLVKIAEILASSKGDGSAAPPAGPPDPEDDGELTR